MIRIVQLGRDAKVPVRARAAFFCDECGGHIADVTTAGYYFDADQPFLGQVLIMHDACVREVERRRGQRFVAGQLSDLFSYLQANARPITEWAGADREGSASTDRGRG